MPLKNTIRFIPDKLKEIPDFQYKSRLIIAVAGALILLLSSCKKNTDPTGTPNQAILEKYFENNILNRNFIVALATDNGTNLTSQYAGDTFVLSKTTSYYDGPLKGKIGSSIYTGTWSSNVDYSQLIINLNAPSVLPEFVFLNRSWKFTSKSFPVLKLAPWGSTAAKVLHMQRL